MRVSIKGVEVQVNVAPGPEPSAGVIFENFEENSEILSAVFEVLKRFKSSNSQYVSES